MPEKFVKYRSFNDKIMATELCRLLSELQIPFEWESTEGYFDASFANNDILNFYYVKLRPEDFKRADDLLMESVIEGMQEPVNDYYLFSFSNEELKEVLIQADEWNEFDRYWAKKILAGKGIEIKEWELEKAKTERLSELKRPWVIDKIWILCAIALCMAGIYFIHIYIAVAVVFISGYISFSKKTMPDGQRVQAFSDGDRLMGKIILIAGIGLVILILLQYYQIIDFIFPL